jgi:hypothetical protein
LVKPKSLHRKAYKNKLVSGKKNRTSFLTTSSQSLVYNGINSFSSCSHFFNESASKNIKKKKKSAQAGGLQEILRRKWMNLNGKIYNLRIKVLDILGSILSYSLCFFPT